MQASTYFALLAEFGTGDIPLEICCKKYFGLSKEKAGSLARHHKLPVPAYRGGSQMSQWLINASDLANYIDKQREAAKQNWEKINNTKVA